MLSLEHAQELAQKHIAGLPPIEDCVWLLSDGQRVSAGWYFKYVFKALPDKEKPRIAGAPGYLIGNDSSLRVIGWSELRSMEKDAGKKL